MTKISAKEICVFVFCVVISLFTGFGDVRLLTVSGNSSLVATGLGIILGLVPIALLIFISKFTEEESIFDVLKKKFGIVGIVLNIILVVGALCVLFVSSWLFINFIISQFLTRNSYYILALFFFVVISYCASRGIEVIGRTTIVLSMICLFTVVVVSLFLAPNVEINNIFPIFDVGVGNFIQGAFLFVSFAAIPCFLILAISRKELVCSKKYAKGMIFGYLAGCIVIWLILFLVIGVYGIDMAKIFSYPSYSLLKKIQAFNFIERVENISSIGIFTTYICSFMISLNFIGEYFKRTFKIKSENINKFIIYVVGITVPLISVTIFQTEFLGYIYTIYPYFAIAIFIVLVVISGLLLIENFVSKKRRC